ncbi:A-kinase anchor protein 9 isoform X13 [Cricetulus griseus]|uniref:A-kinase anchor protein 9 isoform X13 n=1 Tax=Cricetulus griseus TaxID=10029 RepID=A0A9J7F564_CRIGR|nr:A-kinase anchor protein 9 isoform X13 [Cricetulus griseus]
MEDEERQKKLEAGRAKLVEYRQRKARRDGQTTKKTKKISSCKQDEHSSNINEGTDEMSMNGSQGVESAGNPDSTIMRALPTGQTENPNQVLVEPESEISITGNHCSSREGEEFGLDNSHSEQGALCSQTHVEIMENELAGKQHEIEELTQQLEGMRATCGTEVLQRLYEFEAAIKQRDSIITQLIANLQQARKEKDETMKEFFQLTEQSQKLQIQFQHLQASETLRSSTHSSTAAELVLVKQQLHAQQQQVEKQNHLLKNYQKKEVELKNQITFLREKIEVYEMEQDKKLENANNKIQEKQAIIEALNKRKMEEDKKSGALQNQLETADKLVGDLKQQLTEMDQENQSLKLELASCKEKENHYVSEIKQFMGIVEELQQRNYKENHTETGIVQRMEKETQRKLDHLQAELDEMYGKQIVHMKEELIKQHKSQIEDLKSQHKGEMENTLKSYACTTVGTCNMYKDYKEQLELSNVQINELNKKLQDTLSEKKNLSEELCVVTREKCVLQTQFNDLLEELNFLRDQIHRARQTISEQEIKLNDARKSLSTVEDLKAEISAASDFRKELELKHESEITNYKIKLEMLEKEKNEVLNRMAESQEAELERLRTQLLFSHEEELSKLKEDLEVEHRINIEKLKDHLGIYHKHQLDDLQNEMSKKMETMQCEKDNLISKQNQLTLEISELRDLQQSRFDMKSEQMTLQINELKKEIDILRLEGKEKGTLEQEIQELQLKTERLEKQLQQKEEDLQEKCTQLEAENSILKDEKKVLEDQLKSYTPSDQEERLIALDSSAYLSKACNCQKEINTLRQEKDDLKQQCIHLNKEIERQRNTFSFAEKNFEVNYQELQEEYACLLRSRDDLEDTQTKQALEYENKLKALTEELHLQRASLMIHKEKPSDFIDAKAFIVEPLEVREVVEKDTSDINKSGGEELMLPRTTTEAADGIVEPCEKLQQELFALQAKQDDLKLQMEAQRICLSLVYSTHADQIREYMEKERDEALCSLKDELVSAQERKLMELQKMHQCQLQALRRQKTGDGKEPLQVLIGRLQKAVSEECCSISKTLNTFLDEHYCPLKCEMNIEEKENSGVYNEIPRLKLQDYRYQVEDFQHNMENFLSKVKDEHNKLVTLQMHLRKIHGQQTDGVKLEFPEENVAEEEAGSLSVCSQAGLQNTDISPESEVSPLPKSEESKEHDKQVQGSERLVNTLEQQLKPTEVHYGAEIPYLQGSLQTIHGLSAQPSVDSVILQECAAQECLHCGNCLHEHIVSITEFPDEFERSQETNMIKLMEKQYQERLEEEVAKVIVSMSVAFAQQTELSRISEGKENSIQSDQASSLCSQEHAFDDVTSQGRVYPQTLSRVDKNFKEQFKPLSSELEEHRKAPLSNHDDLNSDILKSKDQGLSVSQEIFSKDETLTVKPCIHDEVSYTETCKQLEDMRQELVRQYEEHQQAAELLRLAHMRQMERQREDQEQLEEEVKSLKEQLAQRSSINTENEVSERERVLLEELEALKQLSLAGREELCCELRNSSTQTQDGNDTQEVEEHTLKEETLERKPEASTLDVSLSNERHALLKANSRLLKILLEVAKTTAAAEETIGCHVLGILDRSSKVKPATSLLWRSEADVSAKPSVQEESGRVTDESAPSLPGSAIARNDSNWSKVAEEGADLSQQFWTSGFASPELDPENVELMLNVSSRLQAAVEKLLEAISETSSQLEHAKATQTELIHESFRQKQEATESLRCLEELNERLQEESRTREQLAVELNKAESIIDGYSDEKIIFEREIQEKSYIIDHLEQELVRVSSRLQELEEEQQQVQEERELLSRQKEAMRAVAGPVEQQFLHETEKLMKEKLEIQCQAEKVHNKLQKQLKILEVDVEVKTSKLIEMEQERNAELIDLRQQNQVLEKQMEKLKRFIDEQAVDREHERDAFQLEIEKLEQQLKVVPRLQPVSEQQTREVEQLTGHLKEKTDKCSELLLCKEQLQRDVQERNDEIEKLECRIRALEQALIANTDSFPKINDQKQSGGIEAKSELSLEIQLQAERDAIERKEKEISNLEEQLEQFREELENKNEEVQELHMQLEIQRKESTTHLQELQQENKLFKDEIKKLEFFLKDYDPQFCHDQPMLLGEFSKIIQEKDDKIDRLNEQLIKLQEQVEADNQAIKEKDECIKGPDTQIQCLMYEQEYVKKNREKEIEHLKGVIENWQQELAGIEEKTTEITSHPPDTESLQYTLDNVRAEEKASEQKVEAGNEEMAYTKNTAKEANFKMDQIMQEPCTLNKENTNQEQVHTVSMESVGMAVDECQADALQPEDVTAQDSSKLLKTLISVGCLKQNSKGYRSLETQLLGLESSVKRKDLELMQCHKQIKIMHEQGQSKTEMLQKKIKNLQNLLEEKVAAAIVSQAQLEAFQQFVKNLQEKRPSEPERTDRHNVNPLTGDNIDSDVYTLTVRIAELENQVAEMQSSFISEKQHVEITEKKCCDTENVLELQMPPEEDTKKRQEVEEKEGSLQDLDISETSVKLIHASGDCGFLDELEAFGGRLVSHKKGNSYKEQAENYEELLIKEQHITSLSRDSNKVTGQLTNTKENLLHLLEIENWTGDKQTGKFTTSEPIPVDGCSGFQTEGDSIGSSSNQLLFRPPGAQIDTWAECSPEVVMQIISQFTENIEQMKEVYSAEILDMESRILAEAVTFKRGCYVAIQLLTRDCHSLKKMTQCLKSEQVSSIPALKYSNAHQTREIRSSDSESDWGHGFDTASEGGEEGESSTGTVPRVVKGLLRAVHTEGMQMLSLADSPEDDGEDQPKQKVSESWLEERKTFISTILSLKDLISKMQVQRQTEVSGQTVSLESLPDWRGELLLALQDVLLKERSVLLAAFRTELMSSGTKDADGLLNCLQQRVQEQGIEYQTAMECLQKADRRSLLAENQSLHAQINGREVTLNREQKTDTSSQELLDCKMQQSCKLEVQVQHGGKKDRMVELQEQLSSEKMVVSELKNELSRVQLELESTLKAQHEHLKELEVFRLKANEVHLLSDTLAREQKKSQELQYALATEKAKSGHDEEQDKELKALRSTLEEQKQRNIHLDELLGQQRQLLNDLQQQIESQRMLYNVQLAEEQDRNLELQVLLESEKVNIQEMKDTLDKERELHSNGGQPQPAFPPEEILQELQGPLEEKQKHIMELVNESRKYKRDSLRAKQQMEKDRQVQQKTLQVEKETNTLGQQKMEELQSKVEELQRQLQEKRHQVHKLDLEGRRLQGVMQGFQQQELEQKGKEESRRLLYQNVNEGAAWSFTDDRTRNWVLQQKMEGESKDTSYAKLMEMNRKKDDSDNDIEIIRQKLQHVAMKIQQHIAQKACDRLEIEVSDKDALIWVQERIDRIIFRVQRLRDQQEDEHSLVSSSSSCGSLIEMALKQNSELTGHINQLTEEKNHLRNIIMQLEEQIKFYQQTRAGRSCSSRFSLDGGANVKDIIASEKEVWNKEKLTLQKSLKRAEAKVCELKAELRNDALHHHQSPDSENAVFKKIYGKYLRAESFRKALIFQKKYLLLLLGRFQECEDATMGLLARMEGYPGLRDHEMVPGRTEGLTRFRTAIRVSIAITRMKYLVRRWHRVKSSGPININRDDFGLSPGVEKTDPLYHSTSGLELCEDPRHMTCRSRSDLDFPRSPLSFNRYPGTLADFNPVSLTSPQLQHYNPGRTLTDYVTQMDALQRRLGSTSQSGSPALQFHTGMRR